MIYNLIDKKVPNFTASAFFESKIQEIDFYKNKENSLALLLFYPADFTPVCHSELQELEKSKEEFSSRDTKIFSVSTDSAFCHKAYTSFPVSSDAVGGIGQLSYPMIADVNRSISRSYNCLNESTSLCFRAYYIIDKKNIARSFAVTTFGRSIKEILRQIDAINHIEATGAKCLCNWEKPKQ